MIVNKTHKISVWDTNPTSTMLQKIHYRFLTKKMHSLSVVSEHRHEGKTTVSVLLARGLSEVYGLKVLLMDLNPEGDALLNQHLKDAEAENGIIENHQFPFAVFRLKNLKIDWAKNIFDGMYLNRMLSYFTTQYDMVIVDSMSHTNLSDNFLKINTDCNLIVSTDRTLRQRESKLTKELMLNRKPVLGVVFNK